MLENVRMYLKQIVINLRSIYASNPTILKKSSSEISKMAIIQPNSLVEGTSGTRLVFYQHHIIYLKKDYGTFT